MVYDVPSPLSPQGPQITDSFVEVIGTVQDASTLKSQYVSNIGDSIGMLQFTPIHPRFN